MVKIIDFKKIETELGSGFNMLIVQGGLEPIISKTSGRTYLTMRKAYVSTTFDESTCKSLIGMELQGSIHKVKCEPYSYTVPESGEEMVLNYNWQYVDDDLINANKQIIDEEIVN